MTLREKQSIFAKCLAELILYAYSKGYELTFGDAYRDKRIHGEFGEKKSYSAAYSVHKVRLACDFNLFINGKLIDTSHDAWEDLGTFWKSLYVDACWGGDFKGKSNGDYNHFSFSYQGYK